jgi:uncharacterized cupredoxin-like copper-binding protein
MRTAVIAGIVVVVVVIAAVAAFFLILRGPAVREFTLDMVEYAFRQGTTNNPTLRVKVGDIVVIRLNNKGSVTHEFMLFENADSVVNKLRDVVKDLTARDVPEDEAEKQYEEKKAELEEKGIIKVAFEGADADAEPGESVTIRFTATRPGTFTYVCLEVEGSYPDLHYDKGMHGQLIVEQ